MIVVDTSVWIDHIRDQPAPAVLKLRDPLILEHVVVGDIVLTEVLQGARSEPYAARLERDLRRFEVVAMGGAAIAEHAARHYRLMRQHGFTARLPNLYIATFCLENGYRLLHDDRDFDPFETVLGMQVLR